jgi:hypothetical protein
VCFFFHFGILLHTKKPNIDKVKNPTNIEKFECIEYINDKIILIMEFEILNIYFRTRVVDGIIG